MKTSFVLATIAAVATMAGAIPSDDWTQVTRATESVEDIFKSLKKDPAGHEALLPSGMVVSYGKDHKVIIDQKQASKEAVAEYLKVEGAKPNVPAVARPSRRDIEEMVGLVPRQIACDSYACDENEDCQQVGCYGGCRQNFNGIMRCRS